MDRASSLNPLLSEAGFSTRGLTHSHSVFIVSLNPLLSEAGFSTLSLARCPRLPRQGLNPLLSEAGFSTFFVENTYHTGAKVLILF
mgnify:CR=1 FL=1